MRIQIRHPLMFLFSFLKQKPEVKSVEFAVYTYIPRQFNNPRRVCEIRVDQLQEGFEGLIQKIGFNEEIAFQSRVHVEIGSVHEIRYIPMIDLKGRDRGRATRLIKTILEENNWNRASMFDSGRSFHVYFPELLSYDGWVKFMGRILLFNFPEVPELVDSRWVAYSLFAGCSALRWTKNTAQYLSEPSKVLVYNMAREIPFRYSLRRGFANPKGMRKRLPKVFGRSHNRPVVDPHRRQQQSTA